MPSNSICLGLCLGLDPQFNFRNSAKCLKIFNLNFLGTKIVSHFSKIFPGRQNRWTKKSKCELNCALENFSCRIELSFLAVYLKNKSSEGELSSWLSRLREEFLAKNIIQRAYDENQILNWNLRGPELPSFVMNRLLVKFLLYPQPKFVDGKYQIYLESCTFLD